MTKISWSAISACFTAALFSFYNILQLSLINSTAPFIAITFHLSSFHLGILSSSYVWGNALGLIPMGIFIDRFNARPMAMIMLTLSILSSCIIDTTSHWQIIVLMRFFQGLASATSLLICMRIGWQWFPQKANTTIGIMVSIALLGGVIGNDIFPYVVKNVGWQHSFMLAAFIGTIVLILQILFLQENSWLISRKINHLSVFYQSQNIILGIYLGLMSLPIFIFSAAWGNIWLSAFYHLSTTQAGSAGGAIFLGLLCGSPCIGIIADRIKNPKIILQAGALLALGSILFLMFYPNKSFTMISLIFFILGIICSSQNIIFVLLAKNNTNNNLSTATGMASLLENSIGASGQTIFGWILNFSWQEISYFQLSFNSNHVLLHTMIFFVIVFGLGVFLGSIYKTTSPDESNISVNSLN